MTRNSLSFSFMDSQGLEKWHAKLRVFDQQFTYPLGEGKKFSLVHGENYNAYFDRIGETRHALLHTPDEKVVGIMSFIRKKMVLQGRFYYSIYIADLKIDQAYRGQRLAERFYTYLLTHFECLWFYVGCPLLYFVSMKSEKGSIVKSFRGFWGSLFLKPIALMKVYMISPQDLLQKLPRKVVETQGPVHNISTHHVHDSSSYFDCTGILDFYFYSHSTASRVAYLNGGIEQGEAFLTKLSDVAKITNNTFEFVSFALDERRLELISALEEKGLWANSTAAIGGISFLPRLKQGVIALNTDEI